MVSTYRFLRTLPSGREEIGFVLTSLAPLEESPFGFRAAMNSLCVTRNESSHGFVGGLDALSVSDH